jgi:hypothetical protein
MVSEVLCPDEKAKAEASDDDSMESRGTRDLRESSDEEEEEENIGCKGRVRKSCRDMLKISKTKGYRKVKNLNIRTGRFNQVLQCTTCDKEFSKLCNVLDHVRTHLGSRPYSCTLCGQTFA